MNVIEAIKSQVSVRDFLDRKVESDKLSKILEMARLAPSFFNRQEWRVVIIQNNDTKKKLVEQGNTPSFITESPVLIVGCGKPVKPIAGSDQSSYIIDASIALSYLTLAAVDCGIGTCWISIFDENKVKEILGIPNDIRIIALISVGYPKDPVLSVPKKRRLPLSQLVKFEKW